MPRTASDDEENSFRRSISEVIPMFEYVIPTLMVLTGILEFAATWIESH